MKAQASMFIRLAPNMCAAVTIQVIEEAMPAPHEKCDRREPTLSEFEAIKLELSAGNHAFTPPFKID